MVHKVQKERQEEDNNEHVDLGQSKAGVIHKDQVKLVKKQAASKIVGQVNGSHYPRRLRAGTREHQDLLKMSPMSKVSLARWTNEMSQGGTGLRWTSGAQVQEGAAKSRQHPRQWLKCR